MNTCSVCGAPAIRYANYTRGRRCAEHRQQSRRSRFDDAIAALRPRRGVAVDQYELAAMVGCTRAYISMIEQKAFEKLRAAAPWLEEILRAS
jgi:hypothetical protein